MKRLLAALFLCSCAAPLNMRDAESDEFMLERMTSSDVRYELEKVVAELEALGYTFSKKPKNQSMTTTLWNQILLAPDWDDRPDVGKLKTLRHELVHAKQWREYGVDGFAVLYASEAKRWVIEMHGYRQNIRDLCDMGIKTSEIEARIEGIAESFADSYRVLMIPDDHIYEKTKAVLMKEHEEWKGCQ